MMQQSIPTPTPGRRRSIIDGFRLPAGDSPLQRLALTGGAEIDTAP